MRQLRFAISCVALLWGLLTCAGYSDSNPRWGKVFEDASPPEANLFGFWTVTDGSRRIVEKYVGASTQAPSIEILPTHHFRAASFPIQKSAALKTFFYFSGEGRWVIEYNSYWIVTLILADTQSHSLDIRSYRSSLYLTYVIEDPDNPDAFVFERNASE